MASPTSYEAPLTEIEFRDLHWAIVASRYRSLRQAASALNIRQSTLSRNLRDLEYQLGANLFQRTNGGTRPTIEGQEFLDAARRIIEETAAIIGRFKTRSRGETGRLTIGVHSSLSWGNLRTTLIGYRQRFPNVEIQLIDGSSDHLISDLANSAIDVAFVVEDGRQWNDKALSVWGERVVVALPDYHPLSGRDVIQWDELRQETLLLPLHGPGPEFLKLLVNMTGYAEPGRLLRHDVGLDGLLTMVGAGWGVLLTLEGAMGATYPGVTFREMHGSKGRTRLNFSAFWKQENGNPSLPPFLEMLRERYPDLPTLQSLGDGRSDGPVRTPGPSP